MNPARTGWRYFSQLLGRETQTPPAPAETVVALETPAAPKIRRKRRKRVKDPKPSPFNLAPEQAALIVRWAQARGIRELLKDDAKHSAWPSVCLSRGAKPAAWGGCSGVAAHLGKLGKRRKLRRDGEFVVFFEIPAAVTPLHPPRSPSPLEVDARVANFAQDGHLGASAWHG